MNNRLGRNQGANNPMFGRRHSDETRAKMSAALRGRPGNHRTPHTPEARARISAAMKRWHARERDD